MAEFFCFYSVWQVVCCGCKRPLVLSSLLVKFGCKMTGVVNGEVHANVGQKLVRATGNGMGQHA